MREPSEQALASAAEATVIAPKCKDGFKAATVPLSGWVWRGGGSVPATVVPFGKEAQSLRQVRSDGIAEATTTHHRQLPSALTNFVFVSVFSWGRGKGRGGGHTNLKFFGGILVLRNLF